MSHFPHFGSHPSYNILNSLTLSFFFSTSATFLIVVVVERERMRVYGAISASAMPKSQRLFLSLTWQYYSVSYSDDSPQSSAFASRLSLSFSLSLSFISFIQKPRLLSFGAHLSFFFLLYPILLFRSS